MRILVAFALILLAKECWSASHFNTHKPIAGDDEPSKEPPTGSSDETPPATGSNPTPNNNDQNPSPPSTNEQDEENNTELSLLDQYLNNLTPTEREDPRFSGKFFLVIGPNKVFERRHKNNTVWISVTSDANSIFIRTVNGTVTITDSALTVGIKVHIPLNETDYNCMHTARLNLAPVHTCTGMLEVVVLKPPSDWTSGCGMGYQEKAHDYSMGNWQQRERDSGFNNRDDSYGSGTRGSSGHFSQFSSHRERYGTKSDNKQSHENEEQQEEQQPQGQKQRNESDDHLGRKSRRQRKQERKQDKQRKQLRKEKHGQFNQNRREEENWNEDEENFNQEPNQTHRRKSSRSHRQHRGHKHGTEAMTEFLATFHTRNALNETKTAHVHAHDLNPETVKAVRDIEHSMFLKNSKSGKQ